MPKVEFVIIAFPKCGTTSLVDNLNKHSKINCYHDIGNNESILFHSKDFYNPEKREKYEKYLEIIDMLMYNYCSFLLFFGSFIFFKFAGNFLTSLLYFEK